MNRLFNELLDPWSVYPLLTDELKESEETNSLLPNFIVLVQNDKLILIHLVFVNCKKKIF